MLASRIAFTDQSHSTSRTNQAGDRTSAVPNLAFNIAQQLSYAEPETETIIRVQGGESWAPRTGSQDHIIESESSRGTGPDIGSEEKMVSNGINKTVDFEVHESYKLASGSRDNEKLGISI